MKRLSLLHLFLLVGLLLISIPALAQSEATLDAEQWYKKANSELNKTYQQLQSRLKSPQEKANLAKVQRAWIAFRDADSDFRAGISSGGGSAYAMDRMGNQAEQTEERTRQMKTLLSRLP